MSLSSALHNFKDELIKIDDTEREVSSITMRIRKLNVPFYPTLIPLKGFISLELLAFILLTVYRWAEVHFWKKADSYLFEFWLQHAIIAVGFYVFSKSKLSSTSFSNLKSLLKDTWPLLFCHVIIVIDYCVDFKTFTRKSAGTEYYQCTQVLLLPVLLIVIHELTSSEIPSKGTCIVIGLCVWQFSILFQDMEFKLSFIAMVLSLFMAILQSVYLLLLKEKLSSLPVLELIYLLSLSVALILPIFILLNDSTTIRLSSDGFNLHMMIHTVFMALLKVVSSSMVLILLKNGHPLLVLLTVRTVSIPDHFVQALIYKLDCVLSGSKVCILAGIECLILHVYHLLCAEPQLGLK